MKFVKTNCLVNNLTTHIRENTDFPRQTPRQLPSVEANFEGWTTIKLRVMSRVLSVIVCRRGTWSVNNEEQGRHFTEKA